MTCTTLYCARSKKRSGRSSTNCDQTMLCVAIRQCPTIPRPDNAQQIDQTMPNNLLFRCTLCPAGAQHDIRRHTEVSLAFFSTFEPVNLTPNSVMQQEGVPMFYNSASCTALPCLYICPVKNVLGRDPTSICSRRTGGPWSRGRGHEARQRER